MIKAIKKEFTLWKLFLLALLAACAVFICIENSCFMMPMAYINDEHIDALTSDEVKAFRHDPSGTTETQRLAAGIHPKNKLDMSGDAEVRQSFVAKDSRISMIRVCFSNEDSTNCEGQVTVSICDDNGKEIASSTLDANLISNATARFSFSGDTAALNSNQTANTLKVNRNYNGVKINKGQKYWYIVKSENVRSKSGFGVFLRDEKVDDKNSTLKYNGDVLEDENLFASIRYMHFTYLVFVTFFILLFLAALFIIAPWQYIQDALNRTLKREGDREIKLNVVFLRIMFVLTPFFCYYILAKIAGTNLVDTMAMLFSFKGMLNMVILGFSCWLFFVIFNRTKASLIVTTLVWFIFGFVNYVLLLFRDSPLIATDLVNWKTATQVMSSYELTFNKGAMWAIVLTVIWLTAALSLKSYKGLGLKMRCAALALLIAWGFCFNYLILDGTMLEKHYIKVSGFKPKWNYSKHGWALSFFATVSTSIVRKPKGYSVEKVHSVTDKYKSDTVDKVTKTTEKTPNIIVLMNESFSDLQSLCEFETTKDYFPFYRSLKENTIKGTLHSSVFGGSTADTELEFLTGFSMAFFPYHAVPYTSMIKKDLPSLTWSLKARGYQGNIAFHPGMRDSYNRVNVYPLLGFDRHIALEDMEDPELIRAFVSDKSDYDRLIREYEEYKEKDKDTPYYMFNVTIQNHGGYAYSTGVVKSGIAITEDDLKEDQAEQYLNLIKKSDDALKDLIAYFSKVDQPTMIIMFGDHQPRVGEAFYDAVNQRNSDIGALEKEERRYRAAFMIWANYDIREESNVDISANFLAPYVLDMLDAPMTGYNKYLLDFRKKLPVLTAIAGETPKGKLIEPDKKTKFTSLINEYEMIQYNGFFDNKNRDKNFFYLKDK